MFPFYSTMQNKYNGKTSYKRLDAPQYGTRLIWTERKCTRWSSIRSEWPSKSSCRLADSLRCG